MLPSLRRGLAALAFAAPFAASAQSVVPQGSSAPLPRARAVAHIDSLARNAIGRNLTGMTIAAVRGRDTLVFASYGKADVEWDVPMTTDAVFEIGSITKQFTSTAVLMLAAEGKLSLDDEITKWVPDYPTQGHRVTIRRLLDHTSGIKSYTEIQKFGEIMSRAMPRDTLVSLFGHAPFDFAPGDGLIYNNSGYFLLGLVVEAASGQSYATYIEDKIFKPLRMTRSSYCDDRVVTPRRAHGYEVATGALAPARAQTISHVWPYAAGSLCSTAGDLLRWLQALHAGRVLAPASYRALTTPDTLNDGTRVRYAKGLMVGETAGHRMIGHGGDIPGFSTEARWYPDDSLAVVVLYNTLGASRPQTIADSIAVALLGRAAQPVQAGQPLPAPAAALAGRWRGPGRGLPVTLDVTVKDNTISVARPGLPPQALTYLGDWRFVSGNARYTFRGAPAGGTPTAIVMDMGTVVTTLKRLPDGAK